ncbi:xanthine dehydrogenase family protein molybdopterin-binding subunit [Pontibacter pamirensis]|uniref:xanthine dehydrogenase family protein molybdopterin-binding subunit n=1 Tax=Pontibacter pamirensis TaxID=2562824 RepID=UPI001389B786|nr:molybdopterin cofactor-binding domain-containing protein [Pontibacter pamirensis]
MKKETDTDIKSNQEQSQPSPDNGNQFSSSRRRFFKLLGGGIAVTFVLQDAFAFLADPENTAVLQQASPKEVGAWIHIGENDVITVYTGKVEVGQNIRTSLAQVVAEELHVPMASITMVMGDTDLTPYDAGTFGSRSTPSMGPQLRKAAATAQAMLLDMAAEQWKVNISALRVADGKVINTKNNKSLSFGQISKGKQLLKEISDNTSLTPTEKWRVAGTSVPKVNGRDLITGRHKFVSDLKQPGMLYGKVLRAPAFGASLATVDLSAAKAMPGVVVVQEDDFIGVAAPDAPTAAKAIEAIEVSWNKTQQPSRSNIFDYLKQHATDGRGGRGSAEKGSIAQGMAAADKKLAATYKVDYIAHAPMEPRAAVAQWENGKLTVWTGTQRPFGVQDDLASKFNLPKEKVRVIMPDTGSAYGGKHSGEAAVEAARLAKAAQKPVKLTWTREEEFTWAYFRPAGVIEVSSGVKNDGILTSWEFHNYNSGPSGIRTPYEVPNQQIQYHPVESPLYQGSYRGLASTANIFVLESQMDDLASLVNMDPLEFRLKNLQEPRLKAVFEAAAKGFGWGKTKPAPNHGYGIGGGTEKAGFTATCAEIAVDPGTGDVKIVRITTAFECGAIINPEHLDNQILGAIVQGLGGALFEAVDFENGKILNPHFAQYRVPRFKDTPAIEIITLNRKDLPSAGAGEAPIVGIAPAIRNAIADATGVRLKTLPLVPDGLKANLGAP